MKNGIEDLRNHMFAQLERLGDESLGEDGLKREIERAKAIRTVADGIIDTAKAESERLRIVGDTGLTTGTRLLEPAEKPKALEHGGA